MYKKAVTSGPPTKAGFPKRANLLSWRADEDQKKGL